MLFFPQCLPTLIPIFGDARFCKLFLLTLSHFWLLASLIGVMRSWQGLVAAAYALGGESAISAKVFWFCKFSSLQQFWIHLFQQINVYWRRTQAIIEFHSRHSNLKKLTVNDSCIFFWGVVVCDLQVYHMMFVLQTEDIMNFFLLFILQSGRRHYNTLEFLAYVR